MRPISEVEFVNGIAAMATSGQYGETKVAVGIMNFAEQQPGSPVKAVLEAVPDRFRGIRRTGVWDLGPGVKIAKVSGLILDSKIRQGLQR